MVVLGSYGATVAAELALFMSHTLRHGLTNRDWTEPAVYQRGLDLAQRLVWLIGPLLLAVMGVGLGVNLAQTRFLFTLHPLVPDLNRLNPLQGLTRLFSRRGFVELLKSVAKVLIIGFVVYRSLMGNVDLLVGMAGMELGVAMMVLVRVGMAMLLRVAVLLVVLAGLDYLFQRWQFEKDIRLTKQELTQELQNVEGNPLIKGRRRQVQRQLALQRMMQAVPKADVVITNPTHLAIALEYKPEAMIAPTVVAKGQRLVAERIVDLARQHDVPVIRNIPLAHALFNLVEVGQQIPPELYQAMAEVLAFVYQLRDRK
jgi:flagellar biosynthetic protein FlhB